jgi:hypothetical protein
MNDGEGSLAFSAGNRDHYTLGCASCKMVVVKRLISEVGSNFDAAAHPGTAAFGNTLSYRITAARSTYRLGESDAEDQATTSGRDEWTKADIGP